MSADAESVSKVVGPSNNRTADLTPRELQVLRLLTEGATNTQISERLNISSKTTKNHIAAIFQKLDSTNRTQAVVRAVVMGLIDLG
jgi:DNA-binding NarL/FixJ family response regulator